jgi:hypothetical protein
MLGTLPLSYRGFSHPVRRLIPMPRTLTLSHTGIDTTGIRTAISL